jgi:hypothetical protein
MAEETPLAPSETFADLKGEVLERGTVESVKPKKRGRPSNADRIARGEVIGPKAKTAEPVELIPVETVIEIVALPFELIANRKGNHWRLQKQEKEQIGILANKVLNKYAPSWFAQYGEEIALATVLGMVLVVRVMEDIKLNEIAELDRLTDPANTSEVPQ